MPSLALGLVPHRTEGKVTPALPAPIPRQLDEGLSSAARSLTGRGCRTDSSLGRFRGNQGPELGGQAPQGRQMPDAGVAQPAANTAPLSVKHQRQPPMCEPAGPNDPSLPAPPMPAPPQSANVITACVLEQKHRFDRITQQQRWNCLWLLGCGTGPHPTICALPRYTHAETAGARRSRLLMLRGCRRPGALGGGLTGRPKEEREEGRALGAATGAAAAVPVDLYMLLPLAWPV